MKVFILIVLVIPFITEFLKKILGKTKNSPNIIVQALSWIVGVVLMVVCQLLGLSILQDVSILTTMLYGLFVALCANGIADTKIIQSFLSLFKKKY